MATSKPTAAVTAPPALGHYRQAVVAPGSTLHVAGQVSVDNGGNVVGVDDVDAQADQVAANLTAVLADAGCGLADVVALRVYVTTKDAARAWARVRLELFPVDPPASTLVVVAGLASDDWRIEVEAVAALPSGDAG